MEQLTVIGGGRMGEALIGGLIKAGTFGAREVLVVEPNESRRIELAENYPGLVVAADVGNGESFLLAVKPNLILEVCRSLPTGTRRVLSIAAGVRTADIEAALLGEVAVVRAMPNTPALVGQGAAAIAAGSRADEATLDWAEGLLSSVGIVERVTEIELDAVTGVSGSGPAYVFRLAEALTDAGVAEGLDAEVAQRLAVATIAGAGELLRSTRPPRALAEDVTSPGGTTAAGLAALEAGGFFDLIAATVRAATERSKELANQ